MLYNEDFSKSPVNNQFKSTSNLTRSEIKVSTEGLQLSFSRSLKVP